MRRTAILIVAACSLLGAAACGGDDPSPSSSPTPDPAKPSVPFDPASLPETDRIRVGLAGEPGDLDIVNQADRSITRLVYDPLVDMDEAGQFVPGLATAWETTDSVVWTLTLRNDVTFSDGTRFDADAVVAHYDRLMDPENACACAADLSIISEITAVEDTEVEFTLSSPFGGFVAQLADTTGLVPSPSAVDAAGDDYGREPVGTGPYTLSSWQPGLGMQLERNDRYWDTPGRAEVIEISFLPDAQSRFAALRAGDIDLLNEGDVRAATEVQQDGDLQLIDIPSPAVLFAALNTTSPPFDDVKARLAVQYATDRDAIADELHDGFYDTVNDPFGSSAIPSERSSFPDYDPEKAAELVEELGGLSFTFTTVPTTDGLEEAQVLQSMWEAAGMEVEIRQLDRAALIAASIEGDFDATVAIWDRFTDPDLAVYGWFRTGSGKNFSRISDSELDRLLDEGRAEPDADERDRIYGSVAERLADLVPHLYLHTFSGAVIADADVVGIPSVPDGVLRLAHATKAE